MPQTARPRRRSGWRSGRAGAAITIALALTATGAAAIVVSSHESAPLSGPLPTNLLGGGYYAITVTRDPHAQRNWWCSTITTRNHSTVTATRGGGCRLPVGPIINSGGLVSLYPASGRIQAAVIYEILTPNVYALREPDGSLVYPVRSPRLPFGWRAVVISSPIGTSPATDATTVPTLVPLDHTLIPIPTN